MADPAKGMATQLANIEKRTGKSLAQLADVVRKSGLTKFSEIREMLKRDLGMGHGDANSLVKHIQAGSEGAPGSPATSPADAVCGIYAGAKASLRPIHDKLMKEISRFGPFEVAPKKGYLSLRRKKQFAMIGPATNTRVEVGLNMKGVEATGRLVAMPPGGMCGYKVKVTSPTEVDGELLAWIKMAFDASA